VFAPYRVLDRKEYFANHRTVWAMRARNHRSGAIPEGIAPARAGHRVPCDLEGEAGSKLALAWAGRSATVHDLAQIRVDPVLGSP